MNPEHDNAPMPVEPPPPVVDAELEPLMAEPFAQAWQQAPGAGSAAAVRDRLLGRLAASRRAEEPMVTRRRRQVAAQPLGGGVSAQLLYAAEPGRALRPGEPLRVRLIELAPGARWVPEADAQARHREWLVMAGSVQIGTQRLSLRDYHVQPAGQAAPACTSAGGALLFLRESPAVAGAAAATVLDAEAGWPAFAPGIRRRVLWQQDGQAALLYHAEPGASVPVHTHGHDEECLMVQGELFLDDLLLQHGDWQLAPAGTGHRITATDTGVVIYAHGDLDLRFT